MIGTLLVSLLLCLGLALAVLYVVAAPHLRASGNSSLTRLTDRVDAAVQRFSALARGVADRAQETLHRHVQARRAAAGESGSAHLPG